MEAWPERLKRLRNAAGLSQVKVGKALGISGPSVAQWESGRGKPTPDKLPRLSALYRVSIKDLCGSDIPFDQAAAASPNFEAADQFDEDVAEQLVLLNRAWEILGFRERRALLALIDVMAGMKRKSA